MPHRPSPLTSPLLALATLLIGTLATADPAATQPTFDRAKLLGPWTTTYKLGTTDRTLTYTFNPDGTFEEHDSNWGRNWGDWTLDGPALRMHWRGRRGFTGTMRVQSLTDTDWTAEYPARTTRTYTRPAR